MINCQFARFPPLKPSGGFIDLWLVAGCGAYAPGPLALECLKLGWSPVEASGSMNLREIYKICWWIYKVRFWILALGLSTGWIGRAGFIRWHPVFHRSIVTFRDHLPSIASMSCPCIICQENRSRCDTGCLVYNPPCPKIASTFLQGGACHWPGVLLYQSRWISSSNRTFMINAGPLNPFCTRSFVEIGMLWKEAERNWFLTP